MIHTRDDYLKGAIKSIEDQAYPNVELIQVENMDKKKTIGKCWNVGVEKATGEWCFFLGDDDQITPDYLMSLMIFVKTVAPPEMKGVTSYLTAFDTKKSVQVPVKIYPTGMFEREYLIENPFDEELKKRVDTAYYKSGAEEVAGICQWHFGYYYRQHDDMVSGRSVKFMDKDNKKVLNGKKTFKPKIDKRIVK